SAVDDANPHVVRDRTHCTPREPERHHTQRPRGHLLRLALQRCAAGRILFSCDLTGLMNEPAPERAPAREGIDPADEVVGRLPPLPRGPNYAGGPAPGGRPPPRRARPPALHGGGAAAQAAEHPTPADGALEQVGVLLPAASNDLARRQEETKLAHVLAERP